MTELQATIKAISSKQAFTPEMREKMIGQACMKWGTTRRKVLEYLKIVESL